MVQLAGTNPTAATTTATPAATPQAAVTSPNATSVAAAVPQAMGVSGGNIVMVSQGMNKRIGVLISLQSDLRPGSVFVLEFSDMEWY